MGTWSPGPFPTELDDIYIGDNSDEGSPGNPVAGFGGNDFLSGAGGNDRLFGGSGEDTLTGGDGNDYLDGDFATTSLMAVSAKTRYSARMATTRSLILQSVASLRLMAALATI